MKHLPAKLLLAALFSTAVSFLGLAQSVPRHLVFPSPRGEWEIIADWVEKPGGRNYFLRNKKTGQAYFKREISEPNILPRRFNAQWSPDGNYVVLNLYCGRALQGVVIVSVLPKKPKEMLLDELLPKEYLGFNLDASWNSEGELIVNACPPAGQEGKDQTLRVRFPEGQGRFMGRLEENSSPAGK